MRYKIPIIGNLRSLIPQVDGVLSEVENTFAGMTCERISLSYVGVVAEVKIDTPFGKVATDAELSAVAEYAVKVFSEHFPKGMPYSSGEVQIVAYDGVLI